MVPDGIHTRGLAFSDRASYYRKFGMVFPLSFHLSNLIALFLVAIHEAVSLATRKGVSRYNWHYYR